MQHLAVDAWLATGIRLDDALSRISISTVAGSPAAIPSLFHGTL